MYVSVHDKDEVLESKMWKSQDPLGFILFVSFVFYSTSSPI